MIADNGKPATRQYQLQHVQIRSIAGAAERTSCLPKLVLAASDNPARRKRNQAGHARGRQPFWQADQIAARLVSRSFDHKVRPKSDKQRLVTSCELVESTSPVARASSQNRFTASIVAGCGLVNRKKPTRVSKS